MIAALVLIFPFSDANRLWAAASIALPAMTSYLVGTSSPSKGWPRNDRAHRVACSRGGALRGERHDADGGRPCGRDPLLRAALRRWRGRWGTAPRAGSSTWRLWGCVCCLSPPGAETSAAAWRRRSLRARSPTNPSHSWPPPAARSLPHGARDRPARRGPRGQLAGCFTRWMRRSVRRELRRWLLTALAGVIAVGAGHQLRAGRRGGLRPLHPGQQQLGQRGRRQRLRDRRVLLGDGGRIFIAGRPRRWRR